MSTNTKLYRLSSSSKIYLIDSDVFMSIKSRADASILFAGILNLAKLNQVKTVRQVFKEMKYDPILKTEILPHRKLMEVKTEDQYCAEVAAKITIISGQAGHLWPQTGGTTSDPADPWLIAELLITAIAWSRMKTSAAIEKYQPLAKLQEQHVNV